MFMSASAFAGVIGGPLAGAIMATWAASNGWSGWQWVFLLEGIPSVIAGVVTFFYLTDRPEQANWLTDRAARLVHEDLARDRATPWRIANTASWPRSRIRGCGC